MSKYIVQDFHDLKGDSMDLCHVISCLLEKNDFDTATLKALALALQVKQLKELHLKLTGLKEER